MDIAQVTDQQLWNHVFLNRDFDDVLNEIDEQVDQDEYADREEAFIDKVDLTHRFTRSEIKRAAQRLLAFAEEQE